MAISLDDLAPYKPIERNPIVPDQLKLRDEFRDELDAIYGLHAAKRSDYTADSDDRLANYRFSAQMMGVPIERGMLGRMAEKFFRLKSIFEKDGDVKVSDETVQDTLRDIAIICVLLKLELDGK